MASWDTLIPQHDYREHRRANCLPMLAVLLAAAAARTFLTHRELSLQSFVSGNGRHDNLGQNQPGPFMTIATTAQAVLASDELANTSGKQVKTLSVRVEKNLKDFYVTQARAG